MDIMAQKKRNINALLYAAYILLLCLIAEPVSSEEDSCKPYLIDIDQLTAILSNNIRNTPLTAPKVTTKKNDPCQIELKVTALGMEITGCTSPIYDEQSVGLSEIKISKIGVSVPAGLSSVKEKIENHCGRFVKIRAVQTEDNGVLVFFQ